MYTALFALALILSALLADSLVLWMRGRATKPLSLPMALPIEFSNEPLSLDSSIQVPIWNEWRPLAEPLTPVFARAQETPLEEVPLRVPGSPEPPAARNWTA